MNESRERQNIGRDVFNTTRARDLLASVAPDAVKPSRRPSLSRQGETQPPARKRSAPAVAAVSQRDVVRDDKRQPLRIEALRPESCKRRPASFKGSGGSRSFVPWCSK